MCEDPYNKNEPAYSYKTGMSYENFMRRAMAPTSRNNGVHSSNMQNLIDAENGESHVSFLPSFDKQFPKVQGYLVKAIDKLIKRRKAADKIADLERVKALVQNASNTDELMGAVRMGLAYTQDLIGK